MKDTKKVIEHLCNLSKLTLTKAEENVVSIYLAKQLSYMETMNELNTDGIKPTTHVLPVENVVREDVVVEKDKPEELIKCAPEKRNGYFVVPKTIE